MTKSEKQVLEETIRWKWQVVADGLDERSIRRWAAVEATAIGYGGRAIVARATGVALSTIGAGINDLSNPAPLTSLVKVRRRGGGRKKTEDKHPQVVAEIESIVGPTTRGDPESSLCWTTKSTRRIAEEVFERCKVKVCPDVVARILRERNYSLQAPSKAVEGKAHPDRDAQFDHIDAKTKECVARGVPVVSVDTKKKELVGNFKNNGREWQVKGGPELTDIHDFPDQAIGKAIPYGVYDVADNSGFVNVGIDHDTGSFAVASVEAWWKLIGKNRYAGAKELYITADGGGSNGHRLRLWKRELQRFADEHGLAVHVSHYPPGTSKWNKIEHRLFSFISINWRGRPLRTYATIVNLISGTRTKAGLVVRAQIDRRTFQAGIKVTDEEMKSINIVRDTFQGDWNYTISPRPKQ